MQYHKDNVQGARVWLLMRKGLYGRERAMVFEFDLVFKVVATAYAKATVSCLWSRR